jgi:hypothetical protein
MIVQVVLSDEAEGVVSIDFEVIGITATPGDDFRIVGAAPDDFDGTIYFAPGAFVHEFYVDIDDLPYEDLEESLYVTISNPVNATIGTSATETAWIVDNDPFVVIHPAEGYEPFFSEDDIGYVPFIVELVDPGVTGRNTEVTWATSVEATDTATEDVDFVASSGSVSLEAGESAEIRIPIVFDGASPSESDETLHVLLSNATNGVTILLDEAIGTILDAITIPEEDPPPDCQCGEVVGRSVTSLSSNKGPEFWEGDSVTFTAGLSSTTPGPNESFKWEIRPLLNRPLK